MVFENVFFWNTKTRIIYVIQLQDSIENGLKIYPTCLNALVDPSDNSSTPATANFRARIKGSNIPFLNVLLTEGDNDYSVKYDDWTHGLRIAPPSIRRSIIMGPTVEIILEQGLTRIRDSFRHPFQNTQVSKHYLSIVI